MSLRDHFHPPLSLRRHWHAFHNAWATFLSSDLNQKLPEGYFAEPNVQFGIEIDIALFEEDHTSTEHERSEQTTLHAVWSPPAPTQTVPFALVSETVEVQVFTTEAGPVLVGAIELVSPANKDRPEHREAFVSKCQAYLQQGAGLVIVDVVTRRTVNLHALLLGRLNADATGEITDLYAAAYRPVERDEPSLDVWIESLTLGESLPMMPLWLPGELCLPVALEETYERTCREQRIGAA